jgi:hypothetical protein
MSVKGRMQDMSQKQHMWPVWHNLNFNMVLFLQKTLNLLLTLGIVYASLHPGLYLCGFRLCQWWNSIHSCGMLCPLKVQSVRAVYIHIKN